MVILLLSFLIVGITGMYHHTTISSNDAFFFKTHLFYFLYVTCIYVYVPHACLVPPEVRR